MCVHSRTNIDIRVCVCARVDSVVKQRCGAQTFDEREWPHACAAGYKYTRRRRLQLVLGREARETGYLARANRESETFRGTRTLAT